MSLRPQLIFWLANLSLIVLLTACGQSEDPVISRIKRDKQVIIVTHPVNLPFEFAAGTGVQGFDVDVGEEIAADLGVRARWAKARNFEDIFTMLESGEVDLAMSALSITADRSQKYEFSKPYFRSGQGLAIRKEDREKIKAVRDLKGKKVGVQRGTTGEKFMHRQGLSGVEIIEFPTLDDALLALNTKQLDAVIGDSPIIGYSIYRSFPGLTTVGDRLTDEEYAVMVKKGNRTLLDSVNNTLSRLEQSGKLDEIEKKWFTEYREALAKSQEEERALERAKQTPRTIIFRISRAANFNYDLSQLDGFQIVLEGTNGQGRYVSSYILTRGASGSCQVSAIPGKYRLRLGKLTINNVPVPLDIRNRPLTYGIVLRHDGAELILPPEARG